MREHARDRPTLLILSVDVPELTKNVLGELLIGGLLWFKLFSPPQSRDEHVLGFGYTQTPDDVPP